LGLQNWQPMAKGEFFHGSIRNLLTPSPRLVWRCDNGRDSIAVFKKDLQAGDGEFRRAHIDNSHCESLLLVGRNNGITRFDISLLDLPQFALQQHPLGAAQSLCEENAVEVINLVQHNPRQQSICA
jgi:hypothetical protein